MFPTAGTRRKTTVSNAGERFESREMAGGPVVRTPVRVR
jgi:hypothetical protein